jgi:hypothetical protein
VSGRFRFEAGQAPDHIFGRHGNGMEHQPEISTCSQQTPHLSYGIPDEHVGKGKSADHQVEALAAEWKRLACGSAWPVAQIELRLFALFCGSSQRPIGCSKAMEQEEQPLLAGLSLCQA